MSAESVSASEKIFQRTRVCLKCLKRLCVICIVTSYGRESRNSFCMQEFAKRFYKSRAWQRTRAAAWARDKGLCVDCLRKGLIVPAVEVHHIQELTPENIGDPSVSLNLDNLVSLCKDCHADRHRSRQVRYRIVGDGSVVGR